VPGERTRSHALSGATADTPVSNQRPGRSLPGPARAIPCTVRAVTRTGNARAGTMLHSQGSRWGNTPSRGAGRCHSRHTRHRRRGPQDWEPGVIVTTAADAGVPDFSPHSPCSVVPVSQLVLPCWRLTRLTWFRDKRQRGRGSRTAQAAGPLAVDGGYRDTETKQKESGSVRAVLADATSPLLGPYAPYIRDVRL
jgi:hypothetical protein